MSDTPELRRIVALPRRRWEGDAQEVADLITALYARPGGAMRLKAVQGAAIREAYDNKGALLLIRVGGGKTLISFLLPVVMEVQRPLLIIPAALKDKTEREWWAMQAHWKLPRIRTVTYESLGREKHAEFLEQYRPDLIIADEGHRLKNPKAAVTRRVKRYMRPGTECSMVLASGTVTTRSLHDYWHILRWTHGEETMPLPGEWGEMTEWSECLDVNAGPQRLSPGALALLVDHPIPTGEAGLTAVRRAYQGRLTETHGVVSTVDDRGVNCSLQVLSHDVPELDKVEDLFAQMRETWATPDGHTFTQAVDLWRHARELACGFYYVWDPRPPPEWLLARRAWHKFVRETLKHSHKYDTELQVAKACSIGHLSAEEFKAWHRVKDTFKPRTVAKWVSMATIDRAAGWLKKHQGVVWVEHNAFGTLLEEKTGLPYFGEGGLSRSGINIESWTGPCSASIPANSKGRNLQRYNEALVVSPPPNGGVWEQLLGRLHRDGQTADTVVYDVLVPSLEHWNGLQQALRDARYIYESTGQPQKLLIGDVDIPSPDVIASRTGGRWEKRRDA